VSEHKKPHKKRENPQQASAWVPIGPLAPKPEPFTTDWMVLQLLNEWTSEDIKIAIERDIDLDIRLIISLVEDLVLERTVEEVLKWFHAYRPDLYAVLATKDGIEWLKRKIRKGLIQT